MALSLRIRGHSKAVVPDSLRQNVFTNFTMTLDILEKNKTLKLISTYYWWPQMLRTIKEYVSSCKVCQLSKQSNQPTIGHYQIPDSDLQPFDLIGLDKIVLRNEAKNTRHKYLQVIIDHHSRYIWASLTASNNSAAILNILRQLLSSGVPIKRILTDNGSNFTCRSFKGFLSENKIAHSLATPYHPQTCGMVEKANHTLLTRLGAAILEKPKQKWSTLVPFIVKTYNQTPHEVTNFSPKFLLYGIDESPSFADHPITLEEARGLARENTRKAQIKRKNHHDDKHPDVEFFEGDQVLRTVAKHHPYMSKLSPRQQGPFFVKKKINSLVYDIQDTEGRVYRAHASQLRSFKDRESLGAGRIPLLEAEGKVEFPCQAEQTRQENPTSSVLWTERRRRKSHEQSFVDGKGRIGVSLKQRLEDGKRHLDNQRVVTIRQPTRDNWTSRQEKAKPPTVLPRDLNEKYQALLVVKEGITEESIDKEWQECDEYEEEKFDIQQKVSVLRNPDKEETIPIASEDTVINVKLPELALKSYDGSLEGWLPWWAQFSKIHENKNLSDSDRFLYLRQAIVPNSEAYRVVASYPVTGANYALAVQALQERFGDPNILTELYVRRLLNSVISNVKKENRDLSSLYDELSSHLRSLETLGIDPQLSGIFLYPLVESSLPSDILKIWHRHPSSGYGMELAKREESDKGVGGAQERLRQEEPYKRSYNDGTRTRSNFRPATVSSLFGGRTNIKCFFCERTNHASHQCRSIMKMSPGERNDKIRSAHLCFKCLRKGHIQSQCREQLECKNCGRNHLEVLCEGNSSNRLTKPGRVNPKENATEPVASLSSQACTGQVLLMTTVALLRGPNASRRVRILLDSGSQFSYIKQSLVWSIGIERKGEITIAKSLFGGNKIGEEKHGKFMLELENLGNKRDVIHIEALDQRKICDAIPPLPKGDWLEKLKIKGIILPQDNFKGQEIDILIGANYLGMILTGKIVQVEADLTAVETKLGWTLMGNSPIIDSNDNVQQTLNLLTTRCDLKDLWDLEVLGIRDPVETCSKETRYPEIKEKFITKIQRQSDQRYSVGLPWKVEKESILSNLDIAIKRLDISTKKMNSQNKLTEYSQIFRDWLTEGLIERVEENPLERRGYYLPHRPVYKMESKTTPKRPVFDASCLGHNGLSLNQCLEKGPNLLERIPEMMIRFRENKFGVTADIRKAFQMVAIEESERNYLRFLWWEKESDRELIAYRHKRLVFGLNCSPFVLNAVIEYHLQSIRGPLVQWAKILAQSFYMDNCITSLETKQEVQEFQKAAIEIMDRAKMDLREWEYSLEENPEKGTCTKILGVVWNKMEDSLKCELPDNLSLQPKLTKRLVLSMVQRIFDPLGFCAPVFLPPKLLLQRSWGLKLGWDTPLPESMAQEFRTWLDQIKFIELIKTPRYMWNDLIFPTEVHIFCDASQIGYGAVAYLRSETGRENTLTLIWSKVRLAPMKSITIPCLELMAMVLGARLANAIQAALKRKCETTLWSDSTTALSWIKREIEWRVFVRNRVREIQATTNLNDWRFVPSQLNPADLLSRGCPPSQFVQSRWWEGPEWLKKPKEFWPNSEFSINPKEIKVEDDNDLKPLTPNEFLQNGPESSFPEFENLKPEMLHTRYRELGQLKRELKQRFLKEYLGALIQKSENIDRRQLKVGDVVLIGQENLKRMFWPKGRIVNLIPGKDGIVRVAHVKTSTGTLIRALQRLHPLEISSNVKTIQRDNSNTEPQSEAFLGNRPNIESRDSRNRYGRIQPPETFDFSTPNEWPKWRKRFERYLVVSGMKKKEEADKIDLFMYLMGDRADDIFRTFKFEKEEEATKIDSVLKAFDSHFCVRKNIIYERAKFNSRIQEDREPVDEFITSLYKLADSCEFEGLHEQLIRDRIVVGVRDKALSERMQLNSELTLEKAVKMVRQQEAVRQQQVDLQRPSTSQKVNQVKFNSKKQSPKQQQQPSRKKEKSAKTRSRCPKCGGFAHREGQACRAEGQRCNLCSKTGHFANCCPDKQAKTAEVKAVSELDEEIGFLLEVSAVEDSSNLDDDEDECRRRWTAEIQVNGKQLKFKLDSQADVTCVPLCLFKKIMGQQRLVESDINLRAAEFSELQTVGMFISTLRNGNYEIKEKIYVIRRLSEPLLSRRACELLNLARRIEVVATRINPIKEFPEVFEGLGQIGNPYEIKLKPGAKPYAVHTPRRVPIPLMEKLKARLEELEKAGIIAQVNVATEWCAPTVIAGKPNGDIRLCVDLSRLNEHVQREVHPMPVVEHMLGQLREARFFSKLDANSGFHQIPLSPDCQHLTTFITPFGRYKYCRMPFGISLAPEYFQKIMSITLQGMDGVMCYLDDILIFASDSKTHDRILRLVLRKLKEAKVTLNKAKCVFGVPRINFLGHILDEDGIRPDPAKIEAVAEMPAPTDVHGVRRFLGMVNHLGRKLRTTLPVAPENLNPKLVDSQTLKRKEGRRRKDMKSRYDRRCGATDMEELSEGDTVWITDMRTWGIVKQKASTPRIERWSLKLAAFNYTVEFRKTSDNSNVDALSRLPLESSVRESLDEDQVLLRKLNEVPFSFMEVAYKTPQDKILSIVLRNVREGNWKFTRVPRENPLAPHYKINEELSLEFGCLQWRERV
ncbi:hypothetical protein LAZ67_15001604, partial [Cordylochernes scorpioides]